MADYPQRTVTNQSIWDEYESAVRVEALRKKYGNMLFNARSALSPAFRGSAQSRSWKSAINKGGSSLTGLSGRLKMMRDADKEMVAKQFTTKFQDWRRKNPDGTLEQFNKEADEWGHGIVLILDQNMLQRFKGLQRKVVGWQKRLGI